jgi:outer membrane biosynthesis protein TonB
LPVAGDLAHAEREPAPLPASVMLVDHPAAADPAPVPPPVTSRPAAPPSRPTTVDLERATVSVSAVATSSGIPGSNIRAAINRLPLVRCYREALRARGSPAPGTATLELKLDASGYVSSARLQDAQFLPALRGCVEQAARGLRVRDVDTGEASAAVTLSFVSVP